MITAQARSYWDLWEPFHADSQMFYKEYDQVFQDHIRDTSRFLNGSALLWSVHECTPILHSFNADFSRVVSWWVLVISSTVLYIEVLQRSVQRKQSSIVSSLSQALTQSHFTLLLFISSAFDWSERWIYCSQLQAPSDKPRLMQILLASRPRGER